MASSEANIIINIILFSLLFLIYQLQIKKLSVGGYVIAIYVITAVLGLLYYSMPLNPHKNITLAPFLFLFILFVILCLPLFKYDRVGNYKVQYNIKIIRILCRIALVVSVVPLVEVFIRLPTAFSGDMIDSMSEIHDDSEIRFKFSLIGALSYKFVLVFYEVVFLFIIPLLKEKKKSIWDFAGICTILMTKNLYFFVNSSRSSLVWLILTLILVFVFFQDLLSKTEKKMIRRVFFFFIGSVFFLFSIITVARQMGYEEKRGEEHSIEYFVVRYIGEGMLNFNEYLPDLRDHTYGDMTFYPIKTFLGIETYQLGNSGRGVENFILENRLGVSLSIFYTFIGFFVIDMGFAGAFIFLSIIAFLINRKVKVIDGFIPLSSLLLIFTYAKVILIGTNIYPYIWSNFNMIVGIFFIYFILKFNKS